MRQSSGKLMFVNRDRVFYFGLLGARMKPRRPGGITLYFAAEGDIRLRLAGGAWQSLPCCILPAYCAHQVEIDCDEVFSLLFEPERLTMAEQAWLLEFCASPSAMRTAMARIRAAASGPLSQAWARGGLDTAAFDQLLLGRVLETRRIDPRIERALALFETDLGEAELAADACALQAGLSTSRFLHLFKEETGASFRNMRMWKRARRFLQHAVEDSTLTEVALDLGYPDSSHFSHSIRRTYGLKPRSIREGSRELQVIGAGLRRAS
ncbi:helix-turn-helix transcriptional regulator [Pseudodonghicola xiamenensis]|uniref:Transcriptional regulator n=1 Tax=Pseudodonghicola xiamenensis TaxID=337702 RepID=A0A8J3ME44_9RHOB|nr:AraC family transcriptional regulator [Pseudodonghicola xiamenensis]GHG86801.1 transcriptional regulator [Pseudodonghicola xiamenensis]